MSQMGHGRKQQDPQEQRECLASQVTGIRPWFVSSLPLKEISKAVISPFESPLKANTRRTNVTEVAVAKEEGESQISGEMTLLPEEENRTVITIVQGPQPREAILPLVRATPEVQLPPMVPLSAARSILTMRYIRQDEQLNFNLNMKNQTGKIKVHPEQDLWSNLPGPAGQCHHWEQLQ